MQKGQKQYTKGEYLDLVESLPCDLQRSVSIMKEIDAKYQDVLIELDEAYEKYCQENDSVQRRKLQLSIQRALIRSQELGDEKIQIAGQMKKRDEVTLSSGGADKTGGKRSRRQKNGENRESYGGLDHSEDVGGGASREKRAKASSKKKKRSKGKSEREVSPPDLPIDPDEPTYCLCEQVSYGEMIGCDNDECPIEWFHFSCVGLHHKPKGKWYCPKCRGDNEKTMDKALERAKKERAYNR
uniref:Inhibitor of growth protein n=1 Tax=Periophthalmus magnuspinnatus TaxID=409849 RepID=A0A3B4ABA5_9GOBI